MRFNLIGPLEVVTDAGTVCAPSTPKVCQTLALLLTHPNEIVGAETFICELWDASPPRRALATVQTYVHHVRNLLASGRPDRPDNKPAVVTRAPGYILEVDDDAIDVTRFVRLVRRGEGDMEAGQYAAAALHLRLGLELWRGPVMSNAAAGPVLAPRAVYLEELRIRALELRIEAEVHLGRQRELIPELRSLVHTFPYNEWLHGQLISALSNAGRRAEAHDAYRSLRWLLQAELGLEPSPELSRLLPVEPGAAGVPQAGSRGCARSVAGRTAPPKGSQHEHGRRPSAGGSRSRVP